MPLTLPSTSPAQAVTHNPLTTSISTNALPLMPSSPLDFPWWDKCYESENESCYQIYGVVPACIAASGIVIRAAAIEAGISGVLRRELHVLPWPIREIRDVARAPWISVRASAYSCLSKEERINRAARVEPTECARRAIAEMVFGVG